MLKYFLKQRYYLPVIKKLVDDYMTEPPHLEYVGEFFHISSILATECVIQRQDKLKENQNE